MQFELNEQQRMIKEAAADFAAREIAPVAAELDEHERFPRIHPGIGGSQ